MTITRTPLHDAQVCISCGVPATVRGLAHSHVIPRSQAPERATDATNIVLQCRNCHDKVDRKLGWRHRIEDGTYIVEEWSDGAMDFVEIARVRVVVDKKRGHLVPESDSVLSDGAEGGSSEAEHRSDGRSTPPGGDWFESSAPSAPSPSAGEKEEGDEEPQDSARGATGVLGGQEGRGEASSGVAVAAGGDRRSGGGAERSHPPLTHEQRAQEDWSSQALADRNDRELAEEFHDLYRASSVLRLESYRRIDAYRLKHDVMGEAWVNAAEDVFDLRPKTLYGYSRAWQAFEERARQSEFSDALMEMGGGAWQVIGRVPREQWEAMAELALNVAADQGIGRGFASAVAARAQDEGLLPKPKVVKWTAEELHAEVAHYGTEPQKRVIHAFIDFVKERRQAL